MLILVFTINQRFAGPLKSYLLNWSLTAAEWGTVVACAASFTNGLVVQETHQRNVSF
jgi:hypothetical protein